jgi:hypothetical protein
MRAFSTVFGWLIFTCLLAVQSRPVLADTPPAAASSNSTSASSASSTSAQPAAASTAAAATAHSADEVTAQEQKLLSRGYKLQRVNGQNLFCRNEPVLGSHFEKKVCGTMEQLLANEQTSRDFTDRAQRNQIHPMGN